MGHNQKSDFDAAVKRIDEIAEELAQRSSKSRGKSTIELRKLCGKHNTVPTSYKLEGVEKEGTLPQHLHPTGVIEIWKGRYSGKVVALKIITPRGESQAQGAKLRFCKEVVLMKQVEHENILPFYGVSTAFPEFCLVFAWCGNGSIVDYLKKKPDVNRFDLLLGAARGLLFLHNNRLVHGALRPSHILIDDNGTARIATGGRSSIVAVPDTSTFGHSQSGVDGAADEHRFSPPEMWPEEGDNRKLLVTRDGDVYAIAMVAYQVLTGNMPYSGCSEHIVLQKIKAGERPQRPSDGIADPVWEFLEKCWGGDPTKRPQTAKVRDAFSGFRTLPQATHPSDGRSLIEDLPGKLKLQVQGIRISLNKPKQQQFSVKFKYGDRDHTTAPTTAASGDDYSWGTPETWLIETNKLYHGQSVSVEVLRRTSTPIFKKDKVCATGNFSLLKEVNKNIGVKLETPDGSRSVLKICLVKGF